MRPTTGTRAPACSRAWCVGTASARAHSRWRRPTPKAIARRPGPTQRLPQGSGGARAELDRGLGLLGLLGLLSHVRLDDLAFDVDLDFVADDELAVQHRVEPHPEIPAVDLSLGGVPDPVPHPRVIELAVLERVERHRLAGALDSQVTGDPIAVTADVLDL